MSVSNVVDQNIDNGQQYWRAQASGTQLVFTPIVFNDAVACQSNVLQTTNANGVLNESNGSAPSSSLSASSSSPSVSPNNDAASRFAASGDQAKEWIGKAVQVYWNDKLKSGRVVGVSMLMDENSATPQLRCQVEYESGELCDEAADDLLLVVEAGIATTPVKALLVQPPPPLSDVSQLHNVQVNQQAASKKPAAAAAAARRRRQPNKRITDSSSSNDENLVREEPKPNDSLTICSVCKQEFEGDAWQAHHLYGTCNYPKPLGAATASDDAANHENNDEANAKANDEQLFERDAPVLVTVRALLSEGSSQGTAVVKLAERLEAAHASLALLPSSFAEQHGNTLAQLQQQLDVVVAAAAPLTNWQHSQFNGARTKGPSQLNQVLCGLEAARLSLGIASLPSASAILMKDNVLDGALALTRNVLLEGIAPLLDAQRGATARLARRLTKKPKAKRSKTTIVDNKDNVGDDDDMNDNDNNNDDVDNDADNDDDVADADDDDDDDEQDSGTEKSGPLAKAGVSLVNSLLTLCTAVLRLATCTIDIHHIDELCIGRLSSASFAAVMLGDGGGNAKACGGAMEACQLAGVAALRCLASRCPTSRRALLDEAGTALGRLRKGKRLPRLYRPLNSAPAVQMVSALVLQLLAASSTADNLDLNSTSNQTKLSSDVTALFDQVEHNDDDDDEDVSANSKSKSKSKKSKSKKNQKATAKRNDKKPKIKTKEELKEDKELEIITKINSSHESIVELCRHFLVPILRRCTTAGTRDDPGYRVPLENLIQDVLALLPFPEWPAVEPLLLVLSRLLTRYVVPNGVLNASSNAGGSAAAAALANNQSLREWALTLLGSIGAAIQGVIKEAEVAGDHLFGDKAIVADEASCICGANQSKSSSASPTKAIVEDNRFMIACDGCSRWFHGDCVDIQANNLPEKFHCDHCRLLQMLHIDNVTGPTCDKSVELSQVSFEAREFAQQQLVLNALLKISRHTNDSALLDARRLLVTRWFRLTNEDSNQQALAKQWTPPTLSPLAPQLDDHGNGDTSNDDLLTLSLSGTLRLYRHLLVNSELMSMFSTILRAMLSMLSESVIAMRQRALRGIAAIAAIRPKVLLDSTARGAVSARFHDAAGSVREAAVDLIGKYVLADAEFAPRYLPAIVERIDDVAISVRKRVVRILRDVCLLDPSASRVATLCRRLVSRVSDDTSVRSEIVRTFSALWFGPLPKSTTASSTTVASKSSSSSSKSAITASLGQRTDQFMAVVAQLGSKPDFLVDLLCQLLDDDKSGHVRNVVDLICNELLTRTVAADEQRKEDASADRATLVFLNALSGMAVLCRAQPDVALPYAVALAHYLRPNAPTAQSDASAVVRVADIMTRIAPLLAQSDPQFIGNLQADLIDVIKTQAMPVVAAAIRCLGALTTHATNDDLPLRNLHQLVYKHAEVAPIDKAKPNTLRALFVLGELIQYYDFDGDLNRRATTATIDEDHAKQLQQLENDADAVTASESEAEAVPRDPSAVVVDRTLSLLTSIARRSSSNEIQKYAIRAIGSVYIRRPSELASAPIITWCLKASSSSVVQAAMLRALGTLLDAEQRKATPPSTRGLSDVSKDSFKLSNLSSSTSAPKPLSLTLITLPAALTAKYKSTVDDDKGESSGGDVDTSDDQDDDDDDDSESDEENRFVSMVDTPDAGVVASVMQALLPRVLQLSLSVSDSVRTAALSVAAPAVRMGLVSPLAAAPHIVALTADENDTVAAAARKLAAAVHKRHPTLLPLRIVDGVRLAHSAASRRRAATATTNAKNNKKASEGESKAVPPRARGTLYANVRAVNPATHESRWAALYKLFRSSRKQRTNVLTSLLHLVDEPEAVTKSGSVPFVAYVVELLASLPYGTYDEPLLVVHALNRAASLLGATLQRRAETALEIQSDDAELLCAAAAGASLLLELKTFLKKQYQLTDEKCRAYVPGEAARSNDKVKRMIESAQLGSMLSPFASVVVESGGDSALMSKQAARLRNLLDEEIDDDFAMDGELPATAKRRRAAAARKRREAKRAAEKPKATAQTRPKRARRTTRKKPVDDDGDEDESGEFVPQ